MSSDAPLLEGIRVLEVGGGIAGSFAAALLADLGASVVKIAGVDAPCGRRAPHVRGRSGVVAAIDVVLDRSKLLSEQATATPALFAAADIVITEAASPSAVPELPDVGSAVHVVITPFGLDGPRASTPGGELVLQAAGGLLATIEGPDGEPVAAPGHLAARAGGACAALAALHGLDRRRATGRATTVDVSLQEAVTFTGTLPECAHELYACEGQPGSGRYVAPSGLFPCRDGFVRITAVENHQWAGMCDALAHPEWTRGLEDRPVRAEHTELIVAEVTAWTAHQDKAACAALLQRHRVPATPINSPAELLSSPQLAHRGSLVAGEVDGRPATFLGPPWHLDAGARAPARRSGALADLRVTELTHVLAGPIVGALLGALGAQVTRLEDPERLDIYRRIGPFAQGVEGVERGAYFSVANHSKRSVLLDAEHVEDDVRAALDASDVLIENVGASRLNKLGVSPTELAHRGVLTLHVSGFGSTGPLASYRVYANNVQGYGGLAALTASSDGVPARLGTVLADPLSSVIGATIVAAWALGPRRDEGAVADISMAEVVAATIAEFALAASLGDAAHGGEGSDVFTALCEGSDGRWVAIEAYGVGERTALLKALDLTEERAVARAIGAMDARVAADAIVAGGARAAVVVTGAELVHDEHLRVRGFFPEIDHPDPGLGRARLVGLPWRFAGEGPVPLGPPPALGSSSLVKEMG